jgi:prepilin-type N-terminal cleavage/methylation domain-containing protein
MTCKNRAFTLIELLVVIAIIAILAAILFPVFAQAKVAAKKTASISNMKQVALSTQIYMTDSDDILPPLRWYNPADLAIPSTYGFYFYPVLMQPYSKNVEMFLDPTDRGDDPAMRFSACPNAARFDKSGCAYWYLTGAFPSYGYNRRYLNTITPGAFGAITYTGVSATSLGSPAETVMFAEATGKDLVSPSQPIVRNDVGYHRIDAPSFWLPKASADPAARPFDARTQGQLWGRYDSKKVIVNWLDGHTKYVPIDSLVGQGTTIEEKDRFWNGLGR